MLPVAGQMLPTDMVYLLDGYYPVGRSGREIREADGVGKRQSCYR